MSEKTEPLRFPDEKIVMPPEGAIGIRAYARRRTEAGKPISHQAIGKAIASGRIARAVWRDGHGRPWILPLVADALLEENTDPSAQREEKAGGRPREEPPDNLFADGGPRADSISPSDAKERDARALDYSRARATREAVEARLAHLRLQRELGEYVESAKVRARVENVGVLVRDSLRQIPARVAGELAAETDPHRVEERLAYEIDRALAQLAELDHATG